MSISTQITNVIRSLTHKQLVKLAQTGGLKLGDYMKLNKDELFTRVHYWADQFDDVTVQAWINLAFPAGIFHDTRGWKGKRRGGYSSGAQSHAGQPSEPAQGQESSASKDTADSDKPASDAPKDGLTDEEREVIEMIRRVKERAESKSKPAPRSITGTKGKHRAFPELLAATKAGLNVLLVGPAGSGKTHLGEQVAEALGHRFGFTGAINSEYKLLGYNNAEGKLVRTIYREWYENGGYFMADEIDGSSPNALLCINAGIANGHQDFPDGIIKRHADFRILASANTYGNGADRQYVGRNQLDAASLDRFYVIPMDYDESLESSLYGIESKSQTVTQTPCAMTVQEWVGYVQSVRKAIASFGGAIRHIVSMRAVAMGAAMLDSGLDRETIERGALWKHLSASDIAKIKSAIR